MGVKVLVTPNGGCTRACIHIANRKFQGEIVLEIWSKIWDHWADLLGKYSQHSSCHRLLSWSYLTTNFTVRPALPRQWWLMQLLCRESDWCSSWVGWEFALLCGFKARICVALLVATEFYFAILRRYWRDGYKMKLEDCYFCTRHHRNF